MSERAHTPADDGHSSLVGGSTAGRRLACPGSYQMEQKVPAEIKNESSSYADEGTALHECMAYILTNDVVDLDSLIGMEFFGYTMTRELIADAIVPAVEFFDELCDRAEEEGGLQFVIEKRCEMPGIPGAFGTSDVIGRTDKRSFIIDWKFGAGVPVSAEYKIDTQEAPGSFKIVGNPQLMFYAKAASFTHPEMFETSNDQWPVELFICQPRIDESRGKKVSRHSTTIHKLEGFRRELVAAIAEAKGKDPRIAKGGHCTFARCKVVCPLWTGPALDLTKMYQEVSLKESETVALSDDEYGRLLAAVLDLNAALEPYAREAASQAFTFMEEGGTVPGWKLVDKKPGHDKWKDDDKADAYLGRQGLDVNMRRVVKPITPAVARKLLKKIGKELNEERYVAKGVSSGKTLAEEGDHRPAVEASAETMQKIADKLSQIGDK